MKKTTTFLFLFFSIPFFSQVIEISEVISENSIAKLQNQKLLLIDFWATWCAPCIPATKQLEILQESVKDDVFMVSISDESPEKIKFFLKNKEIKLMVLADSEGFTFSKYNVNSRPHSILLNSNGNILWEGHPANLSQSEIKKWVQKSNNLRPVDFNEFALLKKSKAINKKKYKDIEITVLEQSANSLYLMEDNRVFYEGLLSNLLEKLYTVSSLQLDITLFDNKTISFNCSKAIWDSDKQKIIDKLQDKFDFFSEVFSDKKEVIELIIDDENLLWDTNQINWGSDASNYFVGDERIQADNFSLTELAAVLSETKKAIFMYIGKNTNQHDWDFHYLYNNLMVGELESSFGLQLKTKTKAVPIYKIISKKRE